MAGVNRAGPEAQTEQNEWKPSRGSRSEGRTRLALLTLLGLGLSSGVAAMPGFRIQAVKQLHYDKLDPLWEYSGKVMSCTFCHVNKAGGAPWNVFGQALQKGFNSNPKSNFSQVLYTVLKANGDSDGDGYPDPIEVFANTLPGDPESYPDRPLAELEQTFAVAGGAAQYAPAKPKK